jgi:subtilase family serine protease
MTGIGTLAMAAPSLAAPAAPAPRPAVLAASMAPRTPAGAVRDGVLPASQRMTVEVTLSPRDQPVLTALLNGLADRGSPYFHDFLTPAQYDAAFAPTTAQVDAVDAALRAAGLTPGRIAAGGLSIPVTATAAALEHAFDITLAAYRLPGGRVAYANTTAPKISSAVSSTVQGVIGLDDLYQYSAPVPRVTSGRPGVVASLAKDGKLSPATATLGPKPCTAANDQMGNTFDVLSSFYGMYQLYALGDYGQGQKVAVLELEPNSSSDISAFEKCYGVSAKVNYIKVDGGAGSGAGSGEAALDVETIAALAPKATIDVYQAPNNGNGTGEGLYDIFQKFTSADTEKTISVSWGVCDVALSAADLEAQDTLFAKAYAQGQTILSAAGDNGSTSCSSDSNPNSTLSANSPASAPYVTSVGGTALDSNDGGSTVFQDVWNESLLGGGAGGGGLAVWCMPDYQYRPSIPGLISADSATDKADCATSKDPDGYIRETPDVSADADPYSGYVIYYDGSWEGGVGGTSAATPLWASYAALTDASPYCAGYGSGAAGVLPGALYAAAAAHQSAIYRNGNDIFNDVVPATDFPNDNDYTPSGYDGGLYPVTTGYDMATGLGTPQIWNVFSTPSGTAYTYPVMMCQQLATRSPRITSVSPSAGKASATAKVTIKGSGFIAVSGADKVRLYSGSTVLATLSASCSTTACTVTLPKESARTVDLRASVLGSAYTGAVAADRYTYANAPHISSSSPSKGTHNGGTKVTIKGSNFIGVKSVTFNGKAGSKLAVSGTGTITVDTPKGTKGSRIKVVVNAAGGTSNYVLYLYT